MRYVSSKSANSCTQEPHHVAQKLTSVNLRVALGRSFLKSSAVAGSSCTGCASRFCSASIREACFSSHFVDSDRFWVIGLDRHHRYAFVAIVRSELLYAALVHLRNRAVIARENNDKNWTRGVIRQSMRLSVHARQRKVRSR